MDQNTGNVASPVQSLDLSDTHPVQVKICGLTREDEALACAEAGAWAIGCVFYPPSPRCVSEEQARRICRGLPSRVWGVGVFVNENYSFIMRKVEECGLKAVQLHGREPVDLVAKLRREGVFVIKAVFANGTPSLDSAEAYGASACLVECAGGPLPGGNAMAWDWSAAKALSRNTPLILAGGLNPDNVSDAIGMSSPDAVDVSSGVELSPGRKDMAKVNRFMDAVLRSGGPAVPKRAFGAQGLPG